MVWGKLLEQIKFQQNFNSKIKVILLIFTPVTLAFSREPHGFDWFKVGEGGWG